MIITWDTWIHPKVLEAHVHTKTDKPKLVAELLAWLVNYSSSDMWKEVTWCKLAEPGYAVLPFFAAAQCLGMLQRMGALPAWRLVWGAMEPSGLTWIWSCIGCLVFRNWFCKLFIDLELSNKRNSWKSCKWTACRTASCGHVGQETVPFHFKPCPSIWFFFFFKKICCSN